MPRRIAGTGGLPRQRMVALLFAALAIVPGILGCTVDSGYPRPAVPAGILALLWGARLLTMR